MVTYSKFKTIEFCPCSDFVHPWSDNCLGGIMTMLLSSLKGSSKFFLTFYGIKALMKWKGNSNKYSKYHMLKALICSITYAIATGTGFIAFNCLLRNIEGKFTYRTFCLVPGMLSGLGIFFEQPSQRRIPVSGSLQMVMILLMMKLDDFEYLKLTRKNAMLYFMICNSIIMFLIRSQSKIVAGHWFLDPTSPERKAKSSKSQWIKSIAKDGIKYFAIGFGFNLSKKILECITSKQNSIQIVLSAVQKSSFYAPGMFLGLYIMAYQAINDTIEKSLGGESQLAALISGFLAGTPSWFIQPNLPLLAAALASLIQMLCKVVKSDTTRPFRYLEEVLYIICLGIIMRTRALDGEKCPRIIKEVISAMSNKRSDEMSDAFLASISKMESLAK